MPDSTAKVGDVYDVYRNTSLEPWKFGEKKHRPCVCADEGVAESTWTAVSRLTHGIHANVDLRSPRIPAIGLGEDGAWTVRFVHQIRKEYTGKDACAFKGALPPEVLDQLVRKWPRIFVLADDAR